jgi:hypothetical protein
LPQQQKEKKRYKGLLTVVLQVPRIRNDRQAPSTSRRDSDHLGSKLRAARAWQRDRESINFRKRLDASSGHIVARSAASMREGRFRARRRPTVTLFDGSGTLRWWLSSKIHLWAWCPAPVRVRVRAQTLRLLTFYPCGRGWGHALDERWGCALSCLSPPCFARYKRWRFCSSDLRVRTTRW